MYGDYEPAILPSMGNIKTTFFAKGDGVTDDTAAFERAIDTIASQGTIFIPAGTYVITRVSAGSMQHQAIAREPCQAFIQPVCKDWSEQQYTSSKEESM